MLNPVIGSIVEVRYPIAIAVREGRLNVPILRLVYKGGAMTEQHIDTDMALN